MKINKIFYGWWIVVSFFFMSAYVAGIVFYGFTSVLEPLAEEFHWSYAQVSAAASIRDLVTVILSPLLGFLIDRFSPRKVVFIGGLFIGVGLLLFSRITDLWMFYGIFIMLAITLNTCVGVVPMTVVGNWFRKHVSLATGIAVSGSAFGGLLVPLVTQMIGMCGWRMAMVILGFGAWIIILPLSLIIRHKPEQYGYLPYGETSAVSDDGMSKASPSKGIRVDSGVKQALRSRPFWHITAGLFFFLIVAIAVITHIVPYLSSVGIPRTVSSLAASGLALTSIAGRIGFGWFADRYDKRKVISVGFIIVAISLICLGSIPYAGEWLIVAFALLFGFGYGGAFPMVSVLLLEYFGRTRLGSILGINMGITMIGGIMGPPLVGGVYDTYGSYQGVWFAFAGIIVVGMIILITTPSAKTWFKRSNQDD